MTWWQAGLILFIVGGLATVVLTGARRWYVTRRSPDFHEPFDARYGRVMAGNWTPPIEQPPAIVAEENIEPPDGLD
ncbi:hypothetical protein [Mycobacterium branderi]|nr:hypothetical protein [Mycobacterium branderi]MCV7236189.1 hypothetical protein [Mycobacterium branderi]ORA35378.1 hypothetical protein BST20_17375 [Mycobacterium branderi]